ncbi:MAG TPA: hydrogen peroxide-dependent heme synthase [Bryobacteraceae bacterium]|jgi:chlorite dismutase|nr:hydrogen peroxide-dependent heme synthase [Bryobacteraceae bacterium]
MSAISNPAIASENLPPVPLTIEGASVLHQMFRVRWAEWKALESERRREILAEAGVTLDLAGRPGEQTAAYSLLGHKGDLLLIHFRDSFERLNDAETAIQRLALSDFLEPATSYLSVIELGLYESTMKVYASLAERGVQPFSAEWSAEIEQTLERQRAAMRPRLYPEIPASRYVCFYPMDRRRGEDKNWYRLPMAERRRQMQEHGAVGQRYAGQVKQIISGSIGFDDWEWGVDLFADDPLVFKRLIYEMRFDEVSAVYALFGPFYIGIRRRAAELDRIFPVV